MAICTSNLLFLCNVILALTVSDESSSLEVWKTESMITIQVVVVKKCKIENAQEIFCAFN